MSTTAARASLPIHSGHASEQGVRPTMEDEVVIKESFHIPKRGHFSFFGVFDGHGGRAAAIFTRDHLFHLLVQELTDGVEPSLALTRAYLNTDKKFIDACNRDGEHKTSEPVSVPTLSEPSEHKRQSSAAGLAVKVPHISVDSNDTSGTTAVAILLHHDTYILYTANVGDSRAVLSRANGKVLTLTNDHKADRPDEMDRIRRAGGFVCHKRVMGELAISRAIGDLDFKEPGFLFVLADPELCTQPLTAADEFVLLACDGIYDVMSNEQACAFIRDSLAAGKSLDDTCKALVKHAIETLNTRDNVTAVIVKLASEPELASAGLQKLASRAPSDTTLKDSHVMTPNTYNAEGQPQFPNLFDSPPAGPVASASASSSAMSDSKSNSTTAPDHTNKTSTASSAASSLATSTAPHVRSDSAASQPSNPHHSLSPHHSSSGSHEGSENHIQFHDDDDINMETHPDSENDTE